MHKYTRVKRDQDGGKEHDRSGASEEGYRALWAGCNRAVRAMGRGLSDHHVILCKFRLVGAWIKRREVVLG